MSIIKKVLANVVQSLTDQEKSTARRNIGAAYRFDIQFTADSIVNPTSVTANKTLSELQLAISNGNIIYPTLTSSGGVTADVGVVSGKSGTDVSFMFPLAFSEINVVMRGSGTIDVVKFEYMTLPCILDSNSMQASKIFLATQGALTRGVLPVYKANAPGDTDFYYECTGTEYVNGKLCYVFSRITHSHGSASVYLQQIRVFSDSASSETVALVS